MGGYGDPYKGTQVERQPRVIGVRYNGHDEIEEVHPWISPLSI